MTTSILPLHLELSLCREGPMLYMPHDRYVGQSLKLYGEYCAGESALFRQIVKPGAIIVEAGANIGTHSVSLARLSGHTGLLHAFEPQPLLFQLLNANAALNSLLNLQTHQVALGDAAETLFFPAIDYGQENNFGAFGLQSEGALPVKVRTLDSYVFPRLDFLKIDVEGMEQSVLHGAGATIKTHRPLLYVENDRVENSAALIQQILALDYKLWWHFPFLYNPDNYRGNPENTFHGLASINMLGVPEERNTSLDLVRVIDPAEPWLDAFQRGLAQAKGAAYII